MLLICDYTASPAVVVAWYDDAATAPTPAAGLTAVPWAQGVGALGRVGPAPAWLGSDTRPYAAPPQPALPSLQAALAADIDRQAQAQRDLYVTPGGAQAATYMFKQSQAVQAQAAQSTTDAGKTAAQLNAQYPDLANEISITVDPTSGAPATDVYGVMRAVLATLAVWLPLNRQIEATRLKTKAAIAAATTPAAAQAAHDGVTWPAAA